MEKQNTLPPLSPDPLRRPGGILANLGVIIALLTLAVAATLFFTDVRLASLGTFRFTASFLLLFFASCIMYFSLEDTGAYRGRESEEYQGAEATFLRLAEEAELEDGGCALSSFCEEVQERELVRQRRHRLALVGIPYEVFCKEYLGKDGKDLPPTLSRRERKAIIAANACRPIPLSAALLLSRARLQEGMEVLSTSPERLRRRRWLQFLLPAALATFFSAGIVFELLRDPTADTVIACLCKLFTLVFNGVKGFRAGYFNMTRDAAQYHNARARLLREFLRERVPEKAEIS